MCGFYSPGTTFNQETWRTIAYSSWSYKDQITTYSFTAFDHDTIRYEEDHSVQVTVLQKDQITTAFDYDYLPTSHICMHVPFHAPTATVHVKY